MGGVIQKITRISELPNVIYDNVELDQEVIISQSERSQPQVEVVNAGEELGGGFHQPRSNVEKQQPTHS